jgi:hypothetical protein
VGRIWGCGLLRPERLAHFARTRLRLLAKTVTLCSSKISREALLMDTGQIIAIVVAAVVILFVLVCCVAVVVIMVLALLGPAIGNVFSNIVVTPVP